VAQLNVKLTDEEDERLESILRRTGQTSYGFAKDLILRGIREAEADLGSEVVSGRILELVGQLRERKWSLYMREDYSDHNHRKWLEGRNPKATKREVQEAVAYFRENPKGLS